MSVEKIKTLIIGGGQAGLAMSEHLSKRGVPHLVVERHRIAERWRKERWDSLVANGPAWHDRFPTMTFAGIDPDSFAAKDGIVAYFEAYAKQIAAPIRCGLAVSAMAQNAAVRTPSDCSIWAWVRLLSICQLKPGASHAAGRPIGATNVCLPLWVS